MNRLAITFALTATCLVVPQVRAQNTATIATQQTATKEKASEAKDNGMAERELKLAEYLNGIKLIGKFTIDGKEAPPKTEEYTISKCEKMDKADMYRLTARIQYGDVDAEVPLELKILWSGDTPVITMDSFWIPGMGTFDARVMIRRGRYAGTWQHDAVGGHMYGVLKKIESKPEREPKPAVSRPASVESGR